MSGDDSGSVYSPSTGWRHWQVAPGPHPMGHPRGPGRSFYYVCLFGLAAVYTALLLTKMSGSASGLVHTLFPVSMGLLFAAMLGRFGWWVRWELRYRSLSRTVPPTHGQVVQRRAVAYWRETGRAFRYSVVVDQGPGRPAHRFPLDRTAYEAVTEGQWVRVWVPEVYGMYSRIEPLPVPRPH